MSEPGSSSNGGALLKPEISSASALISVSVYAAIEK
jgi:hypothetical protein